MSLNFHLSDEQKQFQEAAHQMMRRFEDKREAWTKQIFTEKTFPEELWQGFAEAGFLGALIPEEYGGSGLGLLPLLFATEAMGSHGLGSALLVVTAMDTACVVRNGSEELKKRVLPGVADGSTKLCFALTEPNAGSNTFRVETRAKKDGDSYVLNGQKVFITGADVADKMLVVTRTTSLDECKEQGLPKAYGVSLFLVDTDTEGFTMKPIPTRGIEGFRQFTLYFEDARVPAENMVGDENGGMMALFNSLNPERILASGIAAGSTDYCLRKAVEYANERAVFGGKPIASHQAISHPLAELKIELESVRMLAYRSAWAFDQGLEPQEVGFWANCAKHKAAEMFINAVDHTIQTLGGYGFSEEYGVIHLWEASRLLRTAPISREMILNFVAEHVLGLARSY